MTSSSSAFALPPALAAKAAPALVADDEHRFAALAAELGRTTAEVRTRLEAARRLPGVHGQAALDRDQEVHRLTARLRSLQRFGIDLCLGRTVTAGPPDASPTSSPDGPSAPAVTTLVGRTGLTGGDGERLVVDWRSPAAEPFFAATHARPSGLASRRRYRWSRVGAGDAQTGPPSPRITDYWDEVFTAEGLDDDVERAALDDQSAFIASLGASRSPRMRDVLGTIQADQDAIIRAGSAGVLVVDGGPGTGKTVVALHRTAYLLYADPRLGGSAHRTAAGDARRTGGVLVVGPSRAYLAYVSDVLPSLGEEGVLTATLRDLVPEGADAVEEADPRVAALKADGRLVDAVDAAVAVYEEPPVDRLLVETPWGEVRVTAATWAEAFAAPDPGTPHHEAREVVWEELLRLLVEQHGVDGEPRDEWGDDGDDDGADDGDGAGVATEAGVRRELARDRTLRRAVERAWPVLDPAVLVGDLWSVPAYLRKCAPHLTREEVLALQREDPTAWTTADLPLLDAARRRLGDAGAARRRRQREAAAAAEREERLRVVEDLIEAEAVGGLMTQLRHRDLQDRLVDETVLPGAEVVRDVDRLAGPFAHVVVDEAQELTDAQWRVLLARCPSRSFTVVGDRAQARNGFTGTWRERLARAGITDVRLASLSVNYRTPTEVMAEAEPVIRAALTDADVPTSIRSSGLPVVRGSAGEVGAVVGSWLAEHGEGTVCVIAEGPALPPGAAPASGLPDDPRLRQLTPELAKGLEFDLVVLLDPQGWSAVDRYVAMTRATQQLVVLTTP